MATLSLRLSDEDAKLFRKYAELNGITVSDFLRRTAIEKIEDEYDLHLYNAAVEAFKSNPVTHTLAEVEADLGIVP